MSHAEFEVLDPRYDAEPAYWPALRRRAGLRADWSWDVLAAQAWCARTPQPIWVRREDGTPSAVVSADWVGSGRRRFRFVRGIRGGRLGGLVVRAPGSSAVPGWWLADGQDLRALVADYRTTMRRELGVGMRGMLLCQLGADQVSEISGRLRVVRRTEDVSVLDTARFRSRDEWLATLARKRRQSLRTIFRAIDGDPSIEVRNGAAAEPAELANLLWRNDIKYGPARVVWPSTFVGYLERLLSQPGVHTLCYRERTSGTLLGVALVLDHPDWPIARSWAALPVEAGGRRDLYFHFYGELVRWVIETGKRGVILGKRQRGLKKTLGAAQVPQYAVAIPVGW